MCLKEEGSGGEKGKWSRGTSHGPTGLNQSHPNSEVVVPLLAIPQICRPLIPMPKLTAERGLSLSFSLSLSFPPERDQNNAPDKNHSAKMGQ